MMHYRKTTALVAATTVFLAMPFDLPGEISLEVQADRLQTDTEGESAAQSTLVVLAADTGGNGFSPADSASIGNGSGLMAEDAHLLDGSGGDDLILWRDDLTLNETDGMLSAFLSNLDYGEFGSVTWEPGQQLGLFWFPELTVDSSDLTAGDAYGFFSQTQSPDAGDVWLSPSDETFEWQLHAFSTDSLVLPTGAGSGTSDPGLFVADSTVIPEPLAAPLVLALGAMAFSVWRRRARTA